MLSTVSVSITFPPPVQMALFFPNPLKHFSKNQLFYFLLTSSLRRVGFKLWLLIFIPAPPSQREAIFLSLYLVFIESVVASVYDEYFLCARLISLQ